MIKATSPLETIPEPIINEELPEKPVSLAPHTSWSYEKEWRILQTGMNPEYLSRGNLKQKVV